MVAKPAFDTIYEDEGNANRPSERLNITFLSSGGRGTQYGDKRLETGISTRTKAHGARGSRKNRGTVPVLPHEIPPIPETTVDFDWFEQNRMHSIRARQIAGCSLAFSRLVRLSIVSRWYLSSIFV